MAGGGGAGGTVREGKEAVKSRRNGWGRGNIVKRKLWRVEGMAGGGGGNSVERKL